MTYDLPELCRLSGVTPRTVRYYIQQGLLPSSGVSGPGAHYRNSHLHRLALIRKLQREHLPLAEIRQRLEEMDDEAVAGALGGTPAAAMASAADYVRSVLGGSAQPAPPGSPLPPSAGHSGERSTWERIRLEADVEIHVRRPLTRHQNHRVERLLEQARAIFESP